MCVCVCQKGTDQTVACVAHVTCIRMMGVCAPRYGTSGGMVHVTDMDTVDISNQSRHFLFRHEHVNLPKSTSASSVVVPTPRLILVYEGY